MLKAEAPATVRQLRREQIVAAARRLVAEDGLEALTFEALERRLDFTRGVVTYHFRGKDDIVEAVLDSAIGDISAVLSRALRENPSSEDRVRAVLGTMLRGFLERPEAGRILLSFWGRLSSDRRAREKNARLYAVYRRQGERLIAAGFPGAAARPLGAVLVAVVIGLAAQEYFEPGAVDTEAAVSEAAAALVLGLKTGRKSRRAP